MMIVLLLLVLACGEKLDADNDGFTVLTGDCDEGDPDINPNGIEICDEVDNNCDGEVDELGAIGGRVWYVDLDGDNYGNEAVSIEACEQPENYAPNKWDCLEDNPNVHPGADEICDGLDNDCDGAVDENTALDVLTWYPDRDGDGYGDPSQPLQSCVAPPDYLADGSDCDDEDPTVHPSAMELCFTEPDDNCNGTNNDEDAYDCTPFYADADGDGYAGTEACLCEADEIHFSATATDCNDQAEHIYPGAPVVSRFAPEDCHSGAGIELSIEMADHTITGQYKFGKNTIFEDIDGDGHVDMLSGNYLDPPALLMGPILSKTDESEAEIFLPGLWLGEMFAFVPDVDGDGKADLAFGVSNCSWLDNGVYLFSTAEEGVLEMEDALQYFPIEPIYHAERRERLPKIVDIDNDGVKEIVTINRDFELKWTDVALTDEPVVSTVTSWNSYVPGYFANDLHFSSDFNGDGINDMVVGVPGAVPIPMMNSDVGIQNISGAVAIYEGPVSEDSFPENIFFSVSESYGPASGSGLGNSVHAQDLNGDGTVDLMTTDYKVNMQQPGGGAVFGWLDPLSNTMVDDDWRSIFDADYIYTGEENDQLLHMMNVGDISGDGEEEIIVRGYESRRDYLIHRHEPGQMSISEIGNPINISDAEVRYYYPVPDISGDGVDELLVVTNNEDRLLFFFGGVQ